MRLADEYAAKIDVLQLLRHMGNRPRPSAPLPQAEPSGAAAAIEIIDAAVAYLEAHDVPVATQLILGTRHPAKAILLHAERTASGMVVMEAPARRRRGDWNWANEAYRVAKKAPVKVVLVTPRVEV